MRVKITNWKKIGASALIISAVFTFLILQTKAATESDAIAVRIMPNTNHDSIETWYASQGFKGSPQSLIVDGYEAIRDGRTVFVNAANLDTLNKKIYTNIYLISYNQESEEKTLDILGQLVSHWKFNNNINNPGYCSISTTNCQAEDCASDYICSNFSGSFNSSSEYTGISAANKGKCILKNARTCNIDSDCPVNLFCDSLKARSIRDVKRLGQLNQINSAISSFKNSNGSYPSLQSGTYVPGASLSVWPNWKETFWVQLGLSQLLIDPVNTLGYCDGYDAKTCWNNINNTFVNSSLILPNGSYAFVYKAAKNGLNYLLCSVFETKNLGYDTADMKITSNHCAVNSSYTGIGVNTAPRVVSYYAEGETGKEFNGYIKVEDAEGDLISWKLSFNSPAPWASGGWPIPVLQDTGDANQKKVYASKAGNSGTYQMDLTLTDSRGAATTTKISVVISAANKPLIEAEDVTYFVDPINPLKYTFSVEGSNAKPSYTIRPLSSNFLEINSAVTEAIKSATVTSVGLNKNKVDFSLLIPTSIKITQNIALPFRITAIANGVSSVKDVNFNLKIEKPVLDFNCEVMARTGKPYPIAGGACSIGKIKNGNHNIAYKILSGPDGLSVGYSNDDAYLSASVINLASAFVAPVKVSATNEYGANSEKRFDLKINTFCGDDEKQKPNTEGRGGLYNDGVEECDGPEGVAIGISTSSAQQYGCTSGSGIESPYPILDNNSCVFKQGDSGGGYCGDGLCQLKVNDSVKETGCNCPSDCLTEQSCCGDGVITGTEVCDTGMPVKSCSDTFSAELPSYCGGIPMSGTQTCKSDCSGWGNCELKAPTIEALSSTGCNSVDKKMIGYSCCELVSCVSDACGCCGRYNDDSEWLDLVASATKTSYSYKKILSPNNGACTTISNTSITCVCGSAGCSIAPLCPKSTDPKKTNNSCVLAQSNTNLKDWTVLTNHTAAAYRCWR